MKFKVGQVVALTQNKNKEYRYISGIGSYRGDPVYFVNGDTALQQDGEGYSNPFWFGFMFRKLTAREAGR